MMKKDDKLSSPKKNVIIVTARGNYVYKGISASGYTVMRPYKDKGLLLRVLREIWFRLGLPEHVWYKKEMMNTHAEYIILQDTLLTKKYLEWVRLKNRDKKLIFTYYNLVGKAKHVLPNEIPEGIDKWTYDDYDARKYKMKLSKSGGYLPVYIGKELEKKYDVFHVGIDKGGIRGKEVLDLQKEFEKLGLHTKFIITAEGRLAKRKKYYSKYIPYEEVIAFDCESRAILNYVMPNQEGPCLRDYEALFNRVKLITNNMNAVNFNFYSKDNIFILGKDKMEDLVKFVRSPFSVIDDKILQFHLFDSYVDELKGNS